jgi:acetyl esterase/lipase
MKQLLIIICIIMLILNDKFKTTHQQFYNLTSGRYEAIQVKLFNNTIHRLMSIPYAYTPNLFEKSELISANNYSNINQQAEKMNKWPSMCVQTRLFSSDFYGNLRLPHVTYMSFDCLTINLYIPANNASNLTCMLFIHGGSNAVGTSSYVDGSALASLGNVIVATINYRLDFMGFFNLPNNDYYKGNYGLWDQLEAIKWLHLNCLQIGCNPNSITLFGHSAGSANVLFHAMSLNHSRPLINRVIMQSGTGLAHWATNYEKYLQNSDLFKKSRYMKTVNETLINFLTVTTCNHTHKYKCLKEKLNNFKEMSKNLDINKLTNEINRTNDSSVDLKILKSFLHLINILSFNDFSLMFGYLIKLKFQTIKNNYNNTDNDLLNETYFQQFNNLNQTRKILKLNISQRLKAILNEQTYGLEQDETCYADLVSSIQSYESGYEICQFLHELNISNSVGFFQVKPRNVICEGDYFLYSPVINYFLTCFTNTYFHNKTTNKNELFDLNTKLIINEMKTCVNTVVNSRKKIKNSIFKKGADDDLTVDYELFRDENYDSDETDMFRNSNNNSGNNTNVNMAYDGLQVKEISSLSDNINNLHRINVDNEFIDEYPHLKLVESKDIGKYKVKEI